MKAPEAPVKAGQLKPALRIAVDQMYRSSDTGRIKAPFLGDAFVKILDGSLHQVHGLVISKDFAVYWRYNQAPKEAYTRVLDGTPTFVY